MDSTKQTSLIDRGGVIAPEARHEQFQERSMRLAGEIAGSKFTAWLSENWGIWESFYRLSDKMRTRGRRYYAARTVVEVMRWNYHLSDAADPDFKLNNNWTPMMARLYNAFTGVSFFQTREHGGRVPLE